MKQAVTGGIKQCTSANEMTRIYLTHCSHKKDELHRQTGEPVSPDSLYTATPTQRFINHCKTKGVQWAIFSDLYGVWFPHEKHEWYEKDPNTLTEAEFSVLLRNFDAALNSYSEICFYYNPGRFHPIYARLLQQSVLGDRVKQITHLREIA
jgi:hypothetical protein